MENTALSVFKNLPFSKTQQTTFVSMAVEEILSGTVNPVEADLHLKAMEEAVKKIRTNEKVKEYTLDEAEKYGKEFQLQGADIKVSSRTTKDFTGIDPVLDDLYNQLEKLKEQIKGREMIVSSGADPATGEVFTPPKTSTSRFLTYTFK